MKKISSAALFGGFIAFSLLCGHAGSAHAAGKYTKKEEAVVATQTELTKPGARVDSKQPGISARGFLFQQREQVREVNNAQLKLLDQLNAITKESDPEKPDVLFRMGQLFEEGARYWNFRARELDQKIFEARAQLTDT